MEGAARESTAARIDTLLRRGLQHYGQGDTQGALRCWREVLAIDPDHPEARDYVSTAEAATEYASEAAPEAPPADASPHEPAREVAARPAAGAGAPPIDGLLADAQQLLGEGDLDAALDLLEAVARRDPSRLEVQGWIEHARARLVKRYRERLTDAVVPRQRIEARDVLRFNLPAHAGFLLSLVDGETPLGDLISLSGMDPFEALRILHGLLEAGIVSVETAA